LGADDGLRATASETIGFASYRAPLGRRKCMSELMTVIEDPGILGNFAIAMQFCIGFRRTAMANVRLRLLAAINMRVLLPPAGRHGRPDSIEHGGAPGKYAIGIPSPARRCPAPACLPMLSAPSPATRTRLFGDNEAGTVILEQTMDLSTASRATARCSGAPICADLWPGGSDDGRPFSTSRRATSRAGSG